MRGGTIEWVDTPCGKRGYRGQRSARRVARETRSKGYDGNGVHPYYCRECGFWHIGHALPRGKVRYG